MSTSNKRIGDIIDEREALPPIKSVDDYQNVDLILIDFDSHESTLPGAANQGKLYYIMTCTMLGETDEFQIRTGAETICKQLEAVSKIDDLPLPIRIVKHGNTRMWKLE